MDDPATLDQLRTLLLVAEAGSFSAAARRLGRTQSAVSTAMIKLEEHVGVALWDRESRTARLTDAGQAVLATARRVCHEADQLRALRASLRQGVEPRVSLSVDALFPLPALVLVCRDFASELPQVDLAIDTQAMSAVSVRVLSGAATLGVVSPMGVVQGLVRHPLSPIRMVPVASRAHPLASARGKLSTRALQEHVQVVLSERGVPGVPDQAVLSPRTWRVSDLHTKHELIRAGLGWGNLPAHLAQGDLQRGDLVELRIAAWRADEHTLHLSAIHREDAVLGPAHRWLLARLADACSRLPDDEPPPPAPRKGRPRTRG